MKLLLSALFAGSVSAFAPSTPTGHVKSNSSTAIMAAEKSKSLPFMNRPPLVSILYIYMCNNILEKVLKESNTKWNGIVTEQCE